MTVTCKSTRYGPGCGHPVDDHTGQPRPVDILKGATVNPCCCCNWNHNDPRHVEQCDRCRPIIAAYLDRQHAAVAAMHPNLNPEKILRPTQAESDV